jgi:hypothetical protein
MDGRQDNQHEEAVEILGVSKRHIKRVPRDERDRAVESGEIFEDQKSQKKKLSTSTSPLSML